jgi:murein L,D-transpeptidase YafK
MKNNILNIQQAAEKLNISESYTYFLLQNQKLTGQKLHNNCWSILESDVDKYLQKKVKSFQKLSEELQANQDSKITPCTVNLLAHIYKDLLSFTNVHKEKNAVFACEYLKKSVDNLEQVLAKHDVNLDTIEKAQESKATWEKVKSTKNPFKSNNQFLGV